MLFKNDNHIAGTCIVYSTGMHCTSQKVTTYMHSDAKSWDIKHILHIYNLLNPENKWSRTFRRNKIGAGHFGAEHFGVGHFGVGHFGVTNSAQVKLGADQNQRRKNELTLLHSA